jgi:Uma2 family endonuclease
MPQIIEPAPYTPEPPPNPIRWTRQECQAMMEAGILVGRYELIEGAIIAKMGQRPLHAFVITRLTVWLFALFGAEFVRFQLPMRVPGQDSETSEPEPDAVGLNRPAADFLQQNPDAADTLLVVEVADTTLRFDLNTKAALYARADIGDYWVIDVEGRQIFVHRQPTPAGYGEIIAYSAEEEVAALAHPEAPVRVADLLPPI